MLHSRFFTSILLSGIFYIAVFSVGNASPIGNFDPPGVRSTLSPRTGTEAKGSFLFPRNQIAAGSTQDTNHSQANSFTGKTNILKTKQQKNEDSLPDVIPKDPNGFFHPAALSRFKSSIASFKAWQPLNFLPDAPTLARTKAQDVASKIDYFIDKISTFHHPERHQGKSVINHLKS